jgi:hypothetical protein
MQTWPRIETRKGKQELSGILSGWHMHLDRLPAAADGVASAFDHAREASLMKQYAARLS